MNINKGELTYLIKPFGILMILLVLILVVTFFGLKQVNLVMAKNEEIKQTEASLNEKIAILENVPVEISGDTTFLDVVMPSKSAAIYGLNQIKIQAILNSLLVSNVKSGSTVSSENGISKVNINFEVEGNKQSIYSFLDSFAKILPLMKIEKIKITNEDPVARATVSLAVFSAPLPETIPSVEGETNTLSDDEIKLLKELSSYTLPQFIQPKPQESAFKQDPFN